MRELIIQILFYAIQLVVLVVLGYVIQFLQTKLGNEKFKKAYNLVKNVVLAIEQTLGSGNGADKKAEAVAIIKKMIGNKLSDDEINILIEAAVKEMNMVLKEKGLK